MTQSSEVVKKVSTSSSTMNEAATTIAGGGLEGRGEQIKFYVNGIKNLGAKITNDQKRAKTLTTSTNSENLRSINDVLQLNPIGIPRKPHPCRWTASLRLKITGDSRNLLLGWMEMVGLTMAE